MMKKNGKRTLALVLAIVLMMSMLLTGCGGNKDTTKIEGFEEDSNVNPKGTTQIVKEKITLTMAVQGNPKVTDFQDNEFTKWVEEKTNIHIEFVVLPTKDVDTKINLMFAAGKDLPDIINPKSMQNNSISKFAADGLIVSHDPYYEVYGDNIKKGFTDYPILKKSVTAIDGNTYSLPRLEVAAVNKNKYGKIFIYKPWLEKLNLEVPKTTDDFYKVLKAFKDLDPNGNGKNDEIPLAGASQLPNIDPLVGLIAPFFPYDFLTAGLLDDHGTITASYLAPEFKQGLEYVNKLVSENLLNPVSFTQDITQLTQLANRKEPILGAFMHNYSVIAKTDYERYYDYEVLDLLDSGTGKGGFLVDDQLAAGSTYLITKDCKNKAAAYRLADFLLSEEASMRMRYGVEGRDWKYLDQKETKLVKYDGKPALFQDLTNVWGKNSNVTWRTDCLCWNSFDMQMGLACEPGLVNPNAYNQLSAEKSLIPYTVGAVIPFGALFFTDAELDEVSLLNSSITDYVREELAAFATGNKPFSDWDKFIKQVKNLNLDKFLKYVQTAYDRQFK